MRIDNEDAILFGAALILVVFFALMGEALGISADYIYINFIKGIIQ